MDQQFSCASELQRALFVRHILENANRFTWTYQGLGFIRLAIDQETRLHVWSKGHAVPNVTSIHDHPWDFKSYVISGVLTNYRYREVEGGLPYLRQEIVCGLGGARVGDPTPVSLICYSAQDHQRNQCYSQTREEIHETDTEPGTVTIIKKRYGPRPDAANVFIKEGETWVSAHPRNATPEEIKTFVRLALDRWAQ